MTMDVELSKSDYDEEQVNPSIKLLNKIDPFNGRAVHFSGSRGQSSWCRQQKEMQELIAGTIEITL